MFRELLGRRMIDKKIEKNLIDLSLIPSKYFEALYIERRTEISSSLFELYEDEEKEKRGELIELLKEGIVDTKIEIAKFALYERMIAVTSSMKDVRLVLTENRHKILEDEYKELIEILREVSLLCKIMFEMVKGLYQNYELALNKMDDLIKTSKNVINFITKFRFPSGKKIDKFDMENPKVLISNSIRESVQSIIDVGEKIIEIIEEFNFNR